MSSYALENFLQTALFLLVVFFIYVGIPLFFIVNLILLIYVLIKNKVTPGKYDKKRVRVHLILTIISLVLVLLVIAATVALYLLLLNAVRYM